MRKRKSTAKGIRLNLMYRITSVERMEEGIIAEIPSIKLMGERTNPEAEVSIECWGERRTAWCTNPVSTARMIQNEILLTSELKSTMKIHSTSAATNENLVVFNRIIHGDVRKRSEEARRKKKRTLIPCFSFQKRKYHARPRRNTAAVVCCLVFM
jgi:hypothetical protein